MSANKFKVGDKVRVREGLVADEFYGDVHFGERKGVERVIDKHGDSSKSVNCSIGYKLYPI